ncbi:50S ribosomal protein L20 [Planctomicrobium piriforme]|uniref:Large ribosomal subunit protein bL20 n=1 Tax=Planctomicrobium piriforme TaxID=1576369 RepID=A0A1I3MTG3_9PLAN|nr:50S ribosomal protein L20 [Planctomicrobium piriforme]SFJ00025.1 large subunit ribosomal protein L20 [Planctomicrobium piriforme]
MRVSYGKARRKKKNRIFREAKGNWGGRSRLWRTVQETIIRARAYAFRDRRVRKREFRSLWITRISAACMQRGLRYSQFMHGIERSGILLNRKMLSEIAIREPAIFDEIVAVVKAALPK